MSIIGASAVSRWPCAAVRGCDLNNAHPAILPHLKPRHFLLALVVVAIWGTNFVVIKEALATLPPFLFAALRFSIAFLPAAFFLKRPAVPVSHLAIYGVLIGAGQFGVLYFAMNGFISPGLASLVVQMQVFFTIGLAMLVSTGTRERVKLFQWLAAALAVAGLLIIIVHNDGHTTPAGLAMVLFAALCWASGNIVGRESAAQLPNINMLAYVVWSSVFAVPPLLVLSLIFEGIPTMTTALGSMQLSTWGAVAWQSVGNTLFGYAVWAWLLARYPASTIAPLALLVPVFGMSASALYLSEPLPAWKLMAASLIMAGLAVNILWPKWMGKNAKQ